MEFIKLVSYAIVTITTIITSMQVGKSLNPNQVLNPQHITQPTPIPTQKSKSVFPNQAEGKDDPRWLVCCDNRGNFFADVSSDIVIINGQISSDGKKFLNSRYCVTNGYPFKDGSEPTYQDCILTLSVTKNFGDFDHGSMYE